MRLLALSVALLSVSLYGADKKTPNEIRLEKEIKELKAEAQAKRMKFAAEEASAAGITRGMNPDILASPTCLEGIAIDGLDVIVEDYSKSDKTFNAKTIGNQVKLRLLQSGIKEGKTGDSNYLLVNALPIDVGGKVGKPCSRILI